MARTDLRTPRHVVENAPVAARQTELERHADRDFAVRRARVIASELGEACFVIELQRGWCIYASEDPYFSDHRPATYIVIEPGS